MKKGSNVVLCKIRSIAQGKMNVISFLRLRNILANFDKMEQISLIKTFVSDYYLSDEMPEEFFDLMVYHIMNDKIKEMLNVLQSRDVYEVISYLKYGHEKVYNIEEITPLQYYSISKKHINNLAQMLKSIPLKKTNKMFELSVEEEFLWKVRRTPSCDESEYIVIAYKMYLSIGLDNSMELLSNKFGHIDYDTIYYWFAKMDVKSGLSSDIKPIYIDFLFNNKKSMSNVMRQVLYGRFKSLFLNFDYFYNNFSNFLEKLGAKMSQSKVDVLLKERFLSKDVTNPNITGDIFEDMVSSYHCRYDVLNTSEEEIQNKNLELYSTFLKNKYASSIPAINLDFKTYYCETLKLNDARNLVLGYRAGNCFRFNGEAAILFSNFLKGKHMRLISVSTQEYKDFAMVLVMRNGNALIAQGIETSKLVSNDIKGKDLYDACRLVLKKMMDYMNSCGDNIVATIIGSTNTNVSNYNNNILPFLVTPILENTGNYYNGIYNYQCLMDLNEGCSLQDIKLYEPEIYYLDKREPIMRRYKNDYSDYHEIEKRLIALRFIRTRSEDVFSIYRTLSGHNELLTSCNTDWYITLFEDGTIDSFIDSDDERAHIEYEEELKIIKSYYDKKMVKVKRKITN